MLLKLTTPTRLDILEPSESDLSLLRSFLVYQDVQIERSIRELKKNYYFVQRYGEEWVSTRLDELKSQLLKPLIFQDDQGFFTLAGLRNKIEEHFPGVIFISEVAYPEFKLIPWLHKPPYEPKYYQSSSIENFLINYHSHVEIATGLGKSLIALMLYKKTGLPTVICTPSASIAKMLHKEAIECFGKKTVGLFGAGKKEIGKDLLICVGKSLSMVEGELMESFKKYKVLISDESHTLPADQFSHFCQGLLGHCPYRWFLSATQERNDGKDLLLEGLIGPRVYEMSIQQGISEGHLAKLSTLIVEVESDSNYASSNAILMKQKHFYRNTQILNMIVQLVQDAMKKRMPVIILIDEHEQEKLLKEKLGDIYAYARGGSDTDKICKMFNAGQLMCVVGTSAVSTGTNFKPVQLTINWQGSKAGTRVKQGPIGRSTRLDPASGKTSCKIVDFKVKNIPMMTRHANARIVFYKAVGPVSAYEMSTGQIWTISA